MTILRSFFAMVLFSQLVLFGPADGNTTMAQQSESKAGQQPYSLVLTTKFHSTNHAPYSGIYINHNPNIEMGISYKRNGTGFFLSKNIDLINVHSSRNFSTAGVFRSFDVNPSKTLTVTPYLGYFFAQANSWVDTGSDLWMAVVTRYTINKKLWLENTTLVGNLLRLNATPSIANRLNARAVIGALKIDAFAWYTHSLHSRLHFASTSVAVTSPEWFVTPSISMMLQASVFQQISEDLPEGAMNRGGMVTVIVPVDFNKSRVKPIKD